MNTRKGKRSTEKSRIESDRFFSSFPAPLDRILARGSRHDRMNAMPILEVPAIIWAIGMGPFCPSPLSSSTIRILKNINK